MFCCHCGKRINDDMKFCPFCGGKVIIPKQEEAPKFDAEDVKPKVVEPSKPEKTIVPVKRRNSTGTGERAVPIRKPTPSDIVVGETRKPPKSFDKPSTIVPLYSKIEAEDEPIDPALIVKCDTPVFKKPDPRPIKPKVSEKKTPSPSVYDVEEDLPNDDAVVDTDALNNDDDDDFAASRPHFSSRSFSGKRKLSLIEDPYDFPDKGQSDKKRAFADERDPYDLEDEPKDEYDLDDEDEDEFDGEYSSNPRDTVKHYLHKLRKPEAKTNHPHSASFDDDGIENSFIFRHLRSVIGALLLMVLLMVVVLYLCSNSGQDALAHIGLAWNAKAYSRLGIEAYNSEDYEGAGAYYKKALSHDPDNFEYATSLAMAYISAGNKEQAVEALTEAIQINPYALEPYLYLISYYPDAETRPNSIQQLIDQGYSNTQDARLAQ